MWSLPVSVVGYWVSALVVGTFLLGCQMGYSPDELPGCWRAVALRVDGLDPVNSPIDLETLTRKYFRPDSAGAYSGLHASYLLSGYQLLLETRYCFHRNSTYQSNYASDSLNTMQMQGRWHWAADTLYMGSAATAGEWTIKWYVNRIDSQTLVMKRWSRGQEWQLTFSRTEP